MVLFSCTQFGGAANSWKVKLSGEEMEILAICLTLLIGGYFIGNKFGNKKISRYKSHINNLISAIVFLLIFIMGFRMGLDKTILQSLGMIGWKAFLFTIGAFVGTISMIILLRKALRMDRKGLVKND